jgi:antitoxin StbD
MTVDMPNYRFGVWPLNEVRGSFPSILDRFAEEGLTSPPVVIGRHRKPEAVMVPYRLFARMLAVYEEQQAPRMLANDVADRAETSDEEFVNVEDLR